MEKVILVDEDDREIGTGEKMQTHLEGKLHRAFSILIFDPQGRLLLQKRQQAKYHSGGLWSNACCGHPRPGESVEAAAQRRLGEEMWLACELRRVAAFIYSVEFGNGLSEHEYDHLFVGVCDRPPAPNAHEVEDWRWVGVEELKLELVENPAQYTYWLALAVAHLPLPLPAAGQ